MQPPPRRSTSQVQKCRHTVLQEKTRNSGIRLNLNELYSGVAVNFCPLPPGNSRSLQESHIIVWLECDTFLFPILFAQLPHLSITI